MTYPDYVLVTSLPEITSTAAADDLLILHSQTEGRTGIIRVSDVGFGSDTQDMSASDVSFSDSAFISDNVADALTELEAKITIAQGVIRVSFSHTDFAGGQLSIGSVPAGLTVYNARLKINTAFDTGQITIGDAGATARIMAVSDNMPAIAGDYIAETDEKYITETELFLYFAGGPVAGDGEAVILIT